MIKPKGSKKLVNKMEGAVYNYVGASRGTFLKAQHGPSVRFENIKPYNPPTEDWCITEDMQKCDYSMMELACDIDEKGNGDHNFENDVLEEGTSPPLDRDPNEMIEADEETLPYVEGDFEKPERMEVFQEHGTGSILSGADTTK